MPYITREDGERFIIPSYRDVLTVAHPSELKKTILELSKNYGEFITLQKKGPNKYEVAYSAETGYLLGESIWHHFNKPLDLIYCEVIPNTTEAILVIVKAGSVYLDGRFPVDSIPEELIIFLTQQNNFEIYVYGDVPISKVSTPGKFSFEASSVKTFTELHNPVFPNLPLLKIYQLQLVEPVLRANGIGVFPIKSFVMIAAIVFAAIGTWFYMTLEKEEEVIVVEKKAEINPYQAYLDSLSSPAPDVEVRHFVTRLTNYFEIPGWSFKDITYTKGNITMNVYSTGGKVADLYAWSEANHLIVRMDTKGIVLTDSLKTVNRTIPKNIIPLDQLIGLLVDKMSGIYPGNILDVGPIEAKGVYSTTKINISLSSATPATLDLIGQQFYGLPLNLTEIKLSSNQSGILTGSLTIEALGK